MSRVRLIIYLQLAGCSVYVNSVVDSEVESRTFFLDYVSRDPMRRSRAVESNTTNHFETSKRDGKDPKRKKIAFALVQLIEVNKIRKCLSRLNRA